MKNILLLAFITILSYANAQNKFGHLVQENKNLSSEWIKSLTDKGEQTVYRGDKLKTIGMPCGGIGAGQLYVRGDGSLACWWIANNAYNTGYGIDSLMNFKTAMGDWKVCYQTFEPFSYIKQGFRIDVKSAKKHYSRQLSKKDFDNISFVGEYPIAKIAYRNKKQGLPVTVDMEVFSSSAPLNPRKSANPATYLVFNIKNNTKKNSTVKLSGFIQNMVMLDLRGKTKGMAVNKVVNNNNFKSLLMSFKGEDSKLVKHPYNGNMALSVMDNNSNVITDINTNSNSTVKKSLGEELVGEVASEVELKSGESKQVVFVLSWYFPNRPGVSHWGGNWNKAIPTNDIIVGNMYSNWFSSSLDVANYMIDNYKELSSLTHNFHRSYYEQNNLPYWLKHRLMMPISTLATETCQWRADGRIWLWEGVGSCVGSCTHVYTYEQAIAFLFPSLERNIREFTDFGTSFNPDGGIQARDGRGGVILDGHAGAILKAYREFLMSDNTIFLSRNWHKIKKAMEFLIKLDKNDDGLIEDKQANTYDIAFYGANTFVGGLYLSALRAAEKMAIEMDDTKFAKKCKAIYEKGAELSAKQLWNGEYFFQDVDLKKHPKFQYANGCLSDQLLGQTWADILDLGYIYPKEKVRKALQSVWKYNWTPDVGKQNKKFVPERYYAHSGEPGLFVCTFPISEHLNENAVRYRNEVWTGIEYQVATAMIYEDMITEGLSLVKAVHERYSPEKHNPWNEIECGDHYGRAMASWGVMLALEDFYYNGSKGIMAFAPKIQKHDFEGFFSSAGAWGNIKQKRKAKEQSNSIEVDYGKLNLKTVRINIADNLNCKSVEVKLNGQKINSTFKQQGNEVLVNFEEQILKEKDVLEVRL